MQIQESLESIKKINNNLEYWSARDLMPFLGYSTWRQFFEVIEKAKEACKTSGNQVSDHFAGASKMV